MWAAIAHEFQNWNDENTRFSKDAYSLKNMFDKLCNAKKPAGDPACRTDVRRAKHIARNIQETIAAKLVEDTESDIPHKIDKTEEEGTKEKAEHGIEAGENRRPISQAGLQAMKLRTEDTISNSMENMTKFMGVIANSFLVIDQNAHTNANQEVMITSDVKKEVDALNKKVNKSMTDTTEMILDMKAALQVLVGKLSETPMKANVQ